MYCGRALQKEQDVLFQYRYDWQHQFWAANVMLATLTDGGIFHAQTESFLKFWICGTDEVRALHSLHHHCMQTHYCDRPLPFHPKAGALQQSLNGLLLRQALHT